MPQRTTAERPMTEKQNRVYRTWASNPGKTRTALAAELGVSREYVRQTLAVVRTKLQGRHDLQ